MPSPTTGAATSPHPAADGPVAFELTGGRWRHATWAIVLGVLALFLAGRIGGLGPIVLGLAIGAFAIRHALAFARSFVRGPGVIRLDGADLVLTPTLHAEELRIPLVDVRSAYVLRRSIALVAAAPVLVLETAKGTFEYPREWFVGDGDQRRVAAAVGRALGYL